MIRPTARVARNRRRAGLYIPLLVVGALAVLMSSPLIFNGADLIGVLALAAGTTGFVLETGKEQ